MTKLGDLGAFSLFFQGKTDTGSESKFTTLRHRIRNDACIVAYNAIDFRSEDASPCQGAFLRCTSHCTNRFVWCQRPAIPRFTSWVAKEHLITDLHRAIGELRAVLGDVGVQHWRLWESYLLGIWGCLEHLGNGKRWPYRIANFRRTEGSYATIKRILGSLTSFLKNLSLYVSSLYECISLDISIHVCVYIYMYMYISLSLSLSPSLSLCLSLFWALTPSLPPSLPPSLSLSLPLSLSSLSLHLSVCISIFFFLYIYSSLSLSLSVSYYPLENTDCKGNSLRNFKNFHGATPNWHELCIFLSVNN